MGANVNLNWSGISMALRKNLRVLVVDDMAISRQLLMQMLETIGIDTVFSASNGLEGLKTLASTPVDIVISDLNMPVMDGLELLMALRDDRRFYTIGFIMCSGEETSEKLDKAWQHGVHKFLPKPFDINKLIACLESVSGRV